MAQNKKLRMEENLTLSVVVQFNFDKVCNTRGLIQVIVTKLWTV